MHLVFCADPLRGRSPDPAYASEIMAAESLNIAYSVVDFEALVDEQNSARAVRRIVQRDRPETSVYRGWMLRPAAYQQLYNQLAGRGIQLINSPQAYRFCHSLPEWYAAVEQMTPRSVWVHADGDFSLEHLMELVRPFGSRPIIVKDFVKSRKHEWFEACYIPSASDPVALERVVRRFLELQGAELNDGLVFREYIQFEKLTRHSISGMPLTKEYRIFFLDGKPLYDVPYWEEGAYADAHPPIDQVLDIAQSIPSRFFTMDIAQRTDGTWMIVELGDAQVAGLPRKADMVRFYERLHANISE